MDPSRRKSFHTFLEENKVPPYNFPSSLAGAAMPEPARMSLSGLSLATSVPSTPGCNSPWILSPLHPATEKLSLNDGKHSPPRSSNPSIYYHCLATLHRLDGNVHSISISNGLVFTASDSGRVRAWSLRDCLDRGYIHIGSSRDNVTAVLGHGGTVVTAHIDRRVRIWAVTNDPDLEPDPDLARVRSRKIATLPPKSHVASFLPAFFGKSSKKAQHHKDLILCMAFYNAEGLLYTGSRDSTVKAWKLSEQRSTDSFVAHEGQINAMLVNQDDGCLFTASSDGCVKIWRRVYGDGLHALIMSLRFQPSPVNCLAMCRSSNSCFLYSGSSDGYVNIWEKEAVSGRFNHAGFLQGHRFAVLCLAAAADRVVLSGSEDTTIRVWKREKGSAFHSCLAVMEGHRGPVRCMAASVEVEVEGIGLLVYSASLDRMVKVWRVKVTDKEEEEENKDEEDDDGEKEAEFEMNPVLSPSWVKRQKSRGY
ncbi:WD repeat-containing protein 86-like protein [Carex littledalei]|uniref:WD repeat-containing protein 86-like protein n=1 Tax=Carex littledalei TaxID=544730 RepID=A0A833VMK0_9POAL|nr:WD repeat-containing protein 86-like protein [Carex littledalei]